MTRLTQRLRDFRNREDGLILTEFLILLPLLIWTFLAMFVYWDAFRTINQAQKASYAISDLISRQKEVDTKLVDGMSNVMQYLTSESDVQVRVTSVQWMQAENKYYVLFSRSPGGKMPALTAANVYALRKSIPAMSDRDSVVIVETLTAYRPAFDIGIPASTFDNFVVTRPRYYRRICLVGGGSCPSNL
ncbi:TadE/TadG family type IV pilus assembly protein [Xinfangfangia pollutisoli]|uniref:TadE/TadG family type IV pilus assembly protein n=1 Tax=Xinfangfangia pollutisoli TaxID=2865960 RepID=UPI001CD68EAF|nr:hypothetical protein [Xinfangfangia pollutisoli]